MKRVIKTKKRVLLSRSTRLFITTLYSTTTRLNFTMIQPERSNLPILL
ncbi:hypothetical protein [Pectobacterium carotovorum]|nr:hypothetical protein [Pectobacterium carotovorum]MBL0868384.1 hypothetical protein [Pectobacterium carotovorum]GKW09556.1 hypothetical protein PEC301889_40380 [Pectobacterium carotovorum subsp. carotovorum]